MGGGLKIADRSAAPAEEEWAPEEGLKEGCQLASRKQQCQHCNRACRRIGAQHQVSGTRSAEELGEAKNAKTMTDRYICSSSAFRKDSPRPGAPPGPATNCVKKNHLPALQTHTATGAPPESPLSDHQLAQNHHREPADRRRPCAVQVPGLPLGINSKGRTWACSRSVGT